MLGALLAVVLGIGTCAAVVGNLTKVSHPPAKDVTVSSCHVDEFGLPSISGVIVNHSSQPSDYRIHIVFLWNGVRVAEGVSLEGRVAPVQTTNWQAVGDKQTDPSAGIVCQIDQVDRHQAL